MLESLKRIFSIEELKGKIIFTLFLLIACRIGAYVSVPGINSEAAVSLFKQATGGGQNLFQLMDVFSGGAFAQMTIIALGVMPYISASIIMQLFMALIPSLQREVRENPEMGRRKLSKWIRILTLVLALLQAGLFGKYALQWNASSPGVIASEIYEVQLFGVPWLFYMLIMTAMTTGTVLLMWIGEQISEKGVGNGISLIITLGILSSLPTTIGSLIKQLNLDSQLKGQLTFSSLIVLCGLFVLIIIGTILIIQGQRKIPLQYARRIVGRHEVQGGTAHIPLKVTYAGVIPVIFASSLLMFPATLGQFIGVGSWIGRLANAISPGTWTYTCFYVILILFFTYFWTATQFHPEQIASDMKKNGAFIPGIRQGKPTQDFLEKGMNRVTLIGASCLAIIAILPTLVGRFLGVGATITYFFGGTSLLILVGVVLDTTKQIESHLLMKRYEGFMKRKKAF
ncbi:MAG TPA: preprotein translocase subunit SecY [Parachlamydiales bacterium]|uniref:Protein translocase subunit SecY n=1 Tax=uncultured Chlamydiae bacterium Rifle_16ft_4_minimus_1822 TaxID=1665093 RepID=A0A0H4TLG8_9BACT|nr:preprotein translocase subunit preprotein translocase subunit SecY [uncultured Chlamydiae bacterium Rifle_16ft_4_minimus_1822]OGN52644.1 MAG: preprotein translocase subunit SecY [Chlamydiae bacterium GWA2_50_15]OGN54081.1 MAG: preprotein translocase subunit SecY [Chlamydiae bacterium GWF2_49_8]OGN57911.1 MAG: preprotein translocase subunit SecY [Chlamydiae bacterium RIFCSPHIGHO2_02_FULL_49_29]OGN63534.1 MAG: preprotein translocase subunit SecY [Chlamydiae bacterium RIFCSPHIGHO2_12_FULL_49_32